MDRWILESVVREWQQRELTTGTRRDLLDTLLAHVDEREALIVSGVRRCGKTTLLFQLVAELEKEAGRDSILYLNLEDERLLGFDVSDFERLLEVFQEERARAGTRSGRLYVALDEVQEVAHWEKGQIVLLEEARRDTALVLSEDQCAEADREFVQFYHRRICWLAIRQFERAVRDADHTLGLMDFCRDHSPDENWTLNHEQYRPFVKFHRTQAATLKALEEDDAELAIEEVK